MEGFRSSPGPSCVVAILGIPVADAFLEMAAADGLGRGEVPRRDAFVRALPLLTEGSLDGSEADEGLDASAGRGSW